MWDYQKAAFYLCLRNLILLVCRRLEQSYLSCVEFGRVEAAIDVVCHTRLIFSKFHKALYTNCTLYWLLASCFQYCLVLDVN